MDSPYEVLAREYMDQNRDVTIDLKPQPNDSYPQTLRSQLQAGNAPDVVQTSPGRGQGNSVVELAEAGNLAQLSSKSAALVQDSERALFGTDSNVYGQPMELTVNGVVANKTAAKKAGVTEFPENTDDLLVQCKELKKQGTSMFALAGSMPPNTGMTAMSISASTVYAADPDWNSRRAKGEVSFASSAGWKKTLETFVRLHDAGCFQGGAEGAGFDVITGNLAQGKSLGAFIPSSAAHELAASTPDSDFAVEAFPSDSDESYILASSNYSLSINTDSKKKAEAQKFLDWLAEPEQSKHYAEVSGSLPVTGLEGVDLKGTVYEDVADLLTAGDYSALPNNGWPNPSVYEALGTGVQGLVTGQRSVKSVLTAMDKAWDE